MVFKIETKALYLVIFNGYIQVPPGWMNWATCMLPYLYYRNNAAWWDCSCKNLCNWYQVLPVALVFFWVESSPEGLTHVTKAAQVSSWWLHTVLEALRCTFNPPGFLHVQVVLQKKLKIVLLPHLNVLNLWFSYVKPILFCTSHKPISF